MGRLIDADELIKTVEMSKNDNPHTDFKIKANHINEHQHFLSMIARQPAAFDVDNAIEKIGQCSFRMPEEYELYGSKRRAVSLENVIDILKGRMTVR